MSKLTWDEEKAIHSDLQARQAELAEAERQQAYAAVQAALSGYRWWSLSNLLNTFRVWLASRRYARANRMR